MREYSTPAVVDVPASARLTDTVFERAEHDPGLVVLRRKASLAPSGARPGGQEAAWLDITARQFRDEVAALAKGFMAAGIGEGDRVALLSRTRYEWTVVDYALWAAGAVTVPVYETSSAEQVEWILTDSGAQAIVVETPARLQAIGEVLRRLPSVRRTWLIEAGEAAAPSLDALVAEGAGVSEADLAQRRTSAGAGDFATIIYTSGTTGRPKGCEITHGNLLANARNAVRGPLAVIFDTPGASTLLFLPLAHSFARLIQVGVIEAGAVLGHIPDLANAAAGPGHVPAHVPPRRPPGVREGLQRRGAAGVGKRGQGRDLPRGGQDGDRLEPRARHRRHALARRAQRARPRCCGSSTPSSTAWSTASSAPRSAAGCATRCPAAPPLGERLGHFFRGAGITIIEGYGLTETTAAATVNRPGRNKIGTVGQPLPGVSVRIAEDGEILLTGLNRFVGYWHNDAATAEALTHDGWLRTGDIGELDDEGYLRVTGRKKELIVTAGGKNVAPAVLEDRIRAHPLVSQCLVVGDGRPVRGLPDHPGPGGRPHLAGPPEPPGGYQP